MISTRTRIAGFAFDNCIMNAAGVYDYTAADNARDDLPGVPENYELLDMDDFLPAEAAEMKATIQRIRRPK